MSSGSGLLTFSNETVAVNDDIVISSFQEFQSLSSRFAAHHKDPVNVLLHFITTPLGCIGLISLLMAITKSTSPATFLSLIYLISLLPNVSLGVFFGTTILTFAIVFVSKKLRLGYIASVALIVVGYVLQDYSHILTGESTFQSTYSAGGQIDLSNLSKWSRLFTEHIYYLIPLCVDVALPYIIPSYAPSSIISTLKSPLPPIFQTIHENWYILGPILVWAAGNYCLDTKNGINIFPGFPYYKRIVKTSLISDGKDSQKDQLRLIREWTMAQNPPVGMSSHWWFRDLPEKEKTAFDQVAKCSIIDNMFRALFSKEDYVLEVVEGMNEVYVTGPSRFEEKFNSDQIFYTKHVDGPWGLIPFVSVYRCIVGMDRNYATQTHFPMGKLSVHACEGDVIGFDFNREVHYITRDDSKLKISDDYRVVLKLHYCVYPRVLAPLGWLMHRLNVNYNQTFRALFLKTIDPQTLYEHFLAWNVVVNTTLFNNIETYIGQRNILYLLFASCLWYFTGQYTAFLLLTSFVHYFRYIGTYYSRTDVDFGSFKRDVLLFKTLAVSQLAIQYLAPYICQSLSSHFPSLALPRPAEWNPISLALVLSGYLVSVLATKALGVDRTYFGAELGYCEPKFVTDFPYGYIPHPMILSQIWALTGIHLVPHMQSTWPWLVPVHIALYTTHMLQEQFQIYRKPVQSTQATQEEVVKKVN